MDLNCVDSLIQAFIFNKLLPDMWSVEVVEVELWLQRTDYKLQIDFSTVWMVDIPDLCVIQGSIVCGI